ncbi:hypothetical protein BUALT_Bualt13G0006800 [Buddleja alternifolia]|uniref:Homeobox domain-containing protein n=1 Tax=Buddleja alternifolia TaxID=168488 RepID=A0AAV6WIU2_9LAMI|nr:hypothetical protein BUALT_Bualt13G0006800 [Buddleja alternifolia]
MQAHRSQSPISGDGKRPRDLLNPKAVKYMQSVFCIKDAISKKETREISARFGVTLTQVRDFFTGQRSRVRKFARLSREKADRSAACDAMHDGTASTSDPITPAEPLPLDTIAPANIEEGPSCSRQHEFLSGMGESDRHFIDNIFSLMRKEESFSGQVKLLQWVLRIENSSVLKWFLTEGGVMILATWLSQAAGEEQTSVLHVILKVLSYLPLREALPVHMSAILQSVNRLRFYRKQDISHRARILLSKWSKMFEKSQSLKKSRGVQSAGDAQAEIIDEVMGNDSWDPKDESSEGVKFLCDNPDNHKKLDNSQPLKLLMAPGDESNKRRGVLPSHTRERRKVQMVEHPGQRLATRSPQIAKSTPVNQSRPLSADDIQKAKMRAQFKQSKYGKAITIIDDQSKPESQNRCSTSSQATQSIVLPPVSKSVVQPEIEEVVKLDDVIEPPLKKYKRIEIPWRVPPELRITETWSVGTGSSSKEVEVQKNRIKRERQAIYREIQQIPSNPSEPWDREMDYDDTLTPEIPIEQLPDLEPFETSSISAKNENLATNESTSSGNNNNNNSMPEPDLELLAELLKNPELVFALTSGKGGELSNEETLKVLDMIKTNSLGSFSGLGGKGQSNVEVSLPSPTPSSDVVPNGSRPDFSRNPFSRQPANMAGNGYQASATVLSNRQQETISTSTFMQHQTQPGPFLGGQGQSLPHVMASPPVLSLQTSIQLPEQWQQQMPTNLPIHPNSTNTQHFTPQMMLNANITNRASSNTIPTIGAEPLARYSASPHVPYLQEPNSMRARQGLESIHHYQNNPTLNNYNGYAEGPAWGSRNNLRERPEFESWSPDNSPSRHYEHIHDRNYNGPRVNLRHGYGPNSGYQDHAMRGAGNKRWRDQRR